MVRQSVNATLLLMGCVQSVQSTWCKMSVCKFMQTDPGKHGTSGPSQVELVTAFHGITGQKANVSTWDHIMAPR